MLAGGLYQRIGSELESSYNIEWRVYGHTKLRKVIQFNRALSSDVVFVGCRGPS